MKSKWFFFLVLLGVPVWGPLQGSAFFDTSGIFNTQSSSSQIITPSEIQSGEYLPVTVRILLPSGEIDTSITGDYTLSSSGATLQTAAIKIYRGVGAVVTRITASGNFNLSVNGFGGNKSIQVDNSPQTSSRSGTLSSNETWTSDRIYRVTDNLVVPNGRKLTIEAGARIFLGKEVNITINGSIEISGEDNNPVLFTSAVHGDSWGGLELKGGDQTSSLAYVIFSDGGGDTNREFGHSNSQPLLLADQTDLTIHHGYFIDNKGKAMATNEATNVVSDCVFYRCDTGAEFRFSNTTISSTYIMQIPDGDLSIDDDDNDGLYFWNRKSSGPLRSTVTNCMIYQTEDEGIDFNSRSQVDISNCFISHCYDKGLSGGNTSDLYCVGNIVTHCMGGGVGSKDQSTVVFENGTLYANDFGLIGYTKYADQGGGFITARNVIISQSISSAVSEDANSDVNVTYSISDTGPLSGTGNLSGNPMMTSPTSGDFTLKEGSPAIDSGDPGGPRDPDGTRADMGALYFPQSGDLLQLIISEINYMPMFNGVENTSFEFIEFYNPNSESMNLTGFIFTAGVTFSFPAGSSLNPNSYLIVCSSNNPWSGSGIDHYQWTQGSLNNQGETIRLENGTGATVAEVSYQISGNWPNPSQQYHFPIELIDLPDTYADGSHWQVTLQYGGTPGFPNHRMQVSQLYINEFVAKSGTLSLDNEGEVSDWIEIYNASTFPINLAGLSLSDDQANPGLYQIPPGEPDLSTVPAGGYLLLWPDAQTNQGVTHVDFELRSAGEDIVLSQLIGGSRVMLDQLSYDLQTEDVSWGRYPDGGATFRFFDTPTPGAANQAGVDYPITGVYINEFMAKFGTIFPDEHGLYSDWIEVYNGGNEPVDLGGLYFTDDLTVPDKVRVPSGYPTETTIIPHGFLVLRADLDPSVGPLHLDIQLASAGEQVGLFQKLNGQFLVVDSVTYLHQETDVSFGRAADGGWPWRKFWTPTPKSTNSATAGRIDLSEDQRSFNVYPNPFTKSITMELVLEKAGKIKAEVMDVTGRKVAESAPKPESVPPGKWIWLWKGKDLQGLDVLAGVYLVSILTDSTVLTSRLIRLPTK